MQFLLILIFFRILLSGARSIKEKEREQRREDRIRELEERVERLENQQQNDNT